MSTAYFYDDFITRKIRFSNRDALINHMNYCQPFIATVEGCYITNTTSYIDILLSNVDGGQGETYRFIYKSSYVRFVNNSDGIEYFAFIDRVEPNNFNSQNFNDVQYEKYYRVYITIDWWTTVMYKDETGNVIHSIKKSLEGNVERAHVNDVEKVGSTFHKTNYYTNKEVEVPFDKIKNALSINLNGNPTTRMFLWCMTAKWTAGNPVSAATILSHHSFLDGLNIYGKNVSFTYKIFIVPLFNCEVLIRNIENTVEVPVNFGNDINPNIIDDRNIVQMFCTNYCPFYNYSENRIVVTVDRETSANALAISNFSFSTSIGEDGKVLALPLLNYYSGSNKIIQLPHNSYVNSDIKTFNNLTVQKPTTYNAYLNTIAKIDYSPYSSIELTIGSDSYEIKGEYIDDSRIFYYNILPEIGGYCFYINKTKNTPLGATVNYIVLSEGNTYAPTSINDYYTEISRNNMITKEVGNQIKNVAKIFAFAYFKNYAGALSSAVSSGASIVDTYTAYEKSKLYGENGFSINTETTSSYVKPLYLNTYEPIDEFKGVILKDLALYGYTTYLHPHEILEEHERKYFNYLKLNNAELILTDFNTEIKLHIEEMFNNGVWLWNTNDRFGDFEVPNYPKLMD